MNNLLLYKRGKPVAVGLPMIYWAEACKGLSHFMSIPDEANAKIALARGYNVVTLISTAEVNDLVAKRAGSIPGWIHCALISMFEDSNWVGRGRIVNKDGATICESDCPDNSIGAVLDQCLGDLLFAKELPTLWPFAAQLGYGRQWGAIIVLELPSLDHMREVGIVKTAGHGFDDETYELLGSDWCVVIPTTSNPPGEHIFSKRICVVVPAQPGAPRISNITALVQYISGEATRMGLLQCCATIEAHAHTLEDVA
jgi:hypothetical protein